MNEVEKRDKINYAKRQIKSCNYLMRERRKILNMIADVNSKLEGIGGRGYEQTFSGHPYPYREADLRDKKLVLEQECDLLTRQIHRIESFLDSLDHKYRVAITDIYIKGRTIEESAVKMYQSRESLKRKIDELMLNF